MVEMRPVDVKNNIINWDYDIGNYPLRENEAEVVIKALTDTIMIEKAKEESNG